MRLKSLIKKYTPDRVIYYIKVLKKSPTYLRAVFTKREKLSINFYSYEETVRMIVEERKSLSRFGDGELMWMAGEKLNSYQDYSNEFARDLTNAFLCKHEDLLIGIPHGLFDSSKCNLYAKMHWRIISLNLFPVLKKYADCNRVYCDTNITRPYIDFSDRAYSAGVFSLLKKIWDGKNVVMIEGEQTKLGVGNDLFDNALSVRRILCPPKNAYEKLEEIKASIRKNVEKDAVLIGALGPTASILAAQLCEEGYQFVDMGHIDIEYMWFLNHAVLREPVAGKYVNESDIKIGSDVYGTNNDYVSSVIDRVS